MLTEVMLEVSYYLVSPAPALTSANPILSFGVAALTDVLFKQRGWSRFAAAHTFSFFERRASPEPPHLVIVTSLAESLISAALFETFLPTGLTNHVTHSSHLVTESRLITTC
jgi:hypothetical protein